MKYDLVLFSFLKLKVRKSNLSERFFTFYILHFDFTYSGAYVPAEFR